MTNMCESCTVEFDSTVEDEAADYNNIKTTGKCEGCQQEEDDDELSDDMEGQDPPEVLEPDR